ncbi:MAG: helix-turn-helix transcriptional regulator [Bacteroidota bacterium]
MEELKVKSKTKKKSKPRRERIKLWGNNLDAALKEKDNMPDIELADLVGTTPAHICRIKSNQTSSISLPIAMKIARVLGKPVESLWILDNPNPVPEKKKSK